MTEKNETMNQIEAILFAAARPVSKEELMALCTATESEIEESINLLSKKLEETDSSVMVISEEEGWKLTVREKYTKPLYNIVPNTELNKSILETLAIIAWKQPVLQSDVINIRTTKAYEHIAELERLGFISKIRQGRTFILKTSKKFAEYFDLPKEEAVKELFKDIKDNITEQKKIDETPEMKIYRTAPDNPDRLGEMDIYETSKKEIKIERETNEEFYETSDDIKSEDYSSKSEQTKEEAGKISKKEEVEEEKDSSEEQEEFSEEKAEEEKESSRKLEGELEEFIEDEGKN